jgi:hypothetical protein
VSSTIALVYDFPILTHQALLAMLIYLPSLSTSPSLCSAQFDLRSDIGYPQLVDPLRVIGKDQSQHDYVYPSLAYIFHHQQLLFGFYSWPEFVHS